MSVVQGEDVESDDECGYETPEEKDENVVDEKEDNSIVPCAKGQGTVVAGEESETDEEGTGSDRETTELPRPLSKNVAKDHEVIPPGESERPLVSTGKSYVYNSDPHTKLRGRVVSFHGQVHARLLKMYSVCASNLKGVNDSLSRLQDNLGKVHVSVEKNEDDVRTLFEEIKAINCMSTSLAPNLKLLKGL